ncbi:MAG: nucleotide exchange factor GrpE [Anaerolineales bacterium]
MSAAKKRHTTSQVNPEELNELQNTVQELQTKLQELQAKNETLQAEIDALKSEQEALCAKADENLAGWQRALADYSNYKRRIERDQEVSYQITVGNVVKRYLPVVDDLERALANRPQSDEGQQWANGIELIYRKLLAALEADGLTTLPTEGVMFDPNLHEAIGQDDSPEHQSGEIIETYQKGYRIGERILRPAVVRIAA